MNKRVGRFCVVLAAMGGCAAPSTSPTPSARSPEAPEKPFALTAAGEAGTAADATAAAASPYAPNKVIASIKDGRFEKQIRMEQVLKPLIEAHGLNTLLIVVQLELAKGLAERAGIAVSPEDVTKEREATFGKLFAENDERMDGLIDKAERLKDKEQVAKLQKQKEDDRKLLLKQFLEQERISPSELDLVFTTNVYLRKLAEPQVANQISDEDVRREFGIRFNEKVRARHIQLERSQDVTEAKRRLTAGEPFEKVAREMSSNQATAALNGELPPFSREDDRLPQNFKDVAFSLKDGEVSDAVEAAGSYHILKVEHRIPPDKRIADPNDPEIQASLRRDLTERVTQAVVTRIRADIGQIAREAMTIKDPVLAEQFKEKISSFQLAQQEAEKRAKEDMERERLKAKADTRPADNVAEPGGLGPKAGPAPAFGEQPAGTQPSATQPATTQPSVGPADTVPGTPAPAVKPVDEPSPSKAGKGTKAAAPAPASPDAASATKPAGPSTPSTLPTGSPK